LHYTLKLGITGLLPPGVGAGVMLNSVVVSVVLKDWDDPNAWLWGAPKPDDGAGLLNPPPENDGTDEDRLGVGTPPVGKLVETFAAPATFSCVRP